MGFSEIKRAILEALQTGFYAHEERQDQEVKNALASGTLSPKEAVAIVQAARGPGRCSPHHADTSILVWEFRPNHHGVRWYVKAYFVEDEDGQLCWFISFHRAT